MESFFVTTTKVVVVGLLLGTTFFYLNKRLIAFYDGRPHLTFRRQLLQIGGALLAVLLTILFMPFDAATTGQLLQLFGLIVSATIALSSTTLVGNVMAGLMLKTIGNIEPGNFVTVGDYFGRISEMDLLHTEIQTEERDLTTLPNLYLVTHPVRVMRSSGTIIFVELSLGYDVSRVLVEDAMISAAKDAGLEKPYVQIRELGDFSVVYRISALLTDVNQLINKRRELRAGTMDALHAANIEIVSPTFMNTRAYDNEATFTHQVDASEAVISQGASPDAVAFDKAERAESVAKLRKKLDVADARLKVCDETIASPPNETAAAAAIAEKEALESRIERLKNLIDRREVKISEEK